MATFRRRVRAFIDPDGLEREARQKRARRGVPSFYAYRIAGKKSRPKPGGVRGRLTADMPGDTMHMLAGIAHKPDRELDWRARGLDENTLDRISIADLILFLCDLSPEISKALWDFLRSCNSGWEVRVLNPDIKEEEVEHDKGKKAVDDFFDQLSLFHGALDVVLNQLFISGFVRGAFFSELVLNKTGRFPIDFVVVDPALAEFERVYDEERGPYWQLGQTITGEFRPLNFPTIAYIPIDPLPGQAPHGRSMVSPAVFAAVFLLMLLHDLRRVVAQQGYPRLDIEIDWQHLLETMPADIQDDPVQAMEWIEAVQREISQVYAELEPDDTYVHLSTIKVNRPIGAVDSSSLGAVEALIRGLERMITRGVKSMPLMMGSNEAVAETHANRQYELYNAGIEALQHLVEQMLERLLRLALEAQGIRAKVKFRFAQLRASERVRDAQAEALEIENAARKYEMGWYSQDEAAEEVTGHKADVATPRVLRIDAGDQVGGDLGSNNVPEGQARTRGRRVARTVLFAELANAMDALEYSINGHGNA